MSNYSEKFGEFLSNYNICGAASLISDNKYHFDLGFYGYENLASQKPISDKTVFKVASISKVIVALGIMKLYEEKKLSLYDDISLYLGYIVRNPNYPLDIITIEMLLTQTSSLNDVGEGEKGYYGNAAGKKPIFLKDLLVNTHSRYYLNSVWLNKKPGTFFNYSNFGCGILACIIEMVAGVGFNDYLKKVLFNPLNIMTSFDPTDIIARDDVATHYIYNSNKKLFEKYGDYSFFIDNKPIRYCLGNNFSNVAGGLYINIIDLNKIMQLLIHNGKFQKKQLFNKNTIKKMKKIAWQGNSSDNAYRQKGLQLICLKGYADTPLWGHFGNAYGLRAFMLFNSSGGYIFIANGGDYLGNEDHLTPLLDKIIKFMIGEKNENNW